MPKGRKYFIVILWTILGCILGSIVTIIIKKYSNLYFDDSISFEINPIEVLSIMVNIILAIYVTGVLSRENDIIKSKKELIISYIKEFLLEYHNKTNKLIDEDCFDEPKTKAYFKTLRKRIHSVLTLTNDFGIIEKNDELASQIKDKIGDIWETFTDTPKKLDEITDEKTKNEIDKLRLEKIGKIETQSIEFEKLILQFIIKINEKSVSFSIK